MPTHQKFINTEITIRSKLTGKMLFVLGGGTKKVTIEYGEMDREKIQWFEPEAINYVPLTTCAWNLRQSPAVGHFTWQQIIDFSEIPRLMIEYGAGLSGDWKDAKDGARGVPLVEIGGKPYRHDAIGQIPFAIADFKDHLSAQSGSGDKEKAIRDTLQKAQQFADGGLSNVFKFGTFKLDRDYDNFFVLRGALWASLRYGRVKSQEQVPIEHGMMSSVDVIRADKIANPAAEKLAMNISHETAVKYGLAD